ncbi:hypothetical protein HMPREF9623_00369 [Stomatobaculum longum]|uniref:Transposase n=1 Tax=Stomatobaculum longum TaxID=796942 RepID=A0AA36Y6S4_9FIRM|nr:transposase [Stomatobaculum longum]EHO18185.1 hypothetical protein HMPREF9623_00369 [Stomatobaculum longum]
MTRISDETRRKVVCAHIQDGRTIASLVAECGISRSTVFNWVRLYREECQNNDEEKSQLEMMEELRRLRREKAELEKENSFLKKQWHSSRRESISGISFT